MAKVLVIGAGGKIGRLLAPQLAQLGHEVTALVRDRSRVEFPDQVNVVEGDIETGVESAVSGADIVVFSAGSGAQTGADKTLLVDLWAAVKIIDQAKAAGVKQFIMVSSRGASNPDLGPESIRPYLVAKHFADNHLVNSGLSFTILRPGRLTDDDAQGTVSTNRPNDLKEQYIARADVASAICAGTDNRAALGQIVELYHGDTTIDQIFDSEQ